MKYIFASLPMQCSSYNCFRLHIDCSTFSWYFRGLSTLQIFHSFLAVFNISKSSMGSKSLFIMWSSHSVRFFGCFYYFFLFQPAVIVKARIHIQFCVILVDICVDKVQNFFMSYICLIHSIPKVQMYSKERDCETGNFINTDY